MKKILFYSGKTVDGEKAIAVIRSLGIEAVLLCDEDLSKTLGAMLGYEEFQKNIASSTHPSFEEAFMILDKISDEEIVSLNEAFKKASEPFLGAKAMVTEHNQRWKLCDLFQEIQQEHAFFQAHDALKMTLIAANDYQKKDYTEISWSCFQGVMLESYMIYQAQGGDTQAILHAHRQLQEAMQQLVKVST